MIYENGPPEVLRYEDIADPDCPEGCVIIDVEAISIEGGDLLARAGSPRIVLTIGRDPCQTWCRQADSDGA